MTDEKMIRGTPELAERLLRYMTGQGSPLLDVGEAWKVGEAVALSDFELAIEELEDLLEGGITEEEREEISDLRAELVKLHPDEPQAGVGEGFRRRRKALGWTQQELAERSGVRVATISDLETGKADKPRRATLRLIESALEAGERGGPPIWTPEDDERTKKLRRAFEAAEAEATSIFLGDDRSDDARARLAAALRRQRRCWDAVQRDLDRWKNRCG